MPAPTPTLPKVVTPPKTTPAPVPTDGDGDHDRFSHYVPKSRLTQALVEGTPVRALCGKIWVPSRDPERYPVCPTCKDIREQMLAGGSGGNANN